MITKQVEVVLENGKIRNINWDPAWERAKDLPPEPPNPVNDCATMAHPRGGWTCDQGGCISSCGMYELDLNNPVKWKEVDWPLHNPKPNHVYICRCK